MGKPISTTEYFEGPESSRPMELVYGVAREPPAPSYGHQWIVTRLTVLLSAHVNERGLGQVCVSPVDVVLDEPGALVVQPDIIFVATHRLGIVRDRVWGAPDLVVEVTSAGTARRDRATKLPWYLRYGVRECWLVDARGAYVEVIVAGDSNSGTRERRTTFTAGRHIESSVLPEWDLSPAAIVGATS